jgi:hypothetical protein
MASIIFKHTCDIDFKDYDVAAGTTTFTGAIVTKDSTSLTDTGGVLLDGDNTLIEATFVGDFTLDPSYPFDFYGILELDVRGLGGDTWIKQISTVYNSISLPSPTDQVWNGTVPINKASLSVTTSPDTVVIAAELDYTKLDFTINEYKLTARLGRIPTLVEFCLTTEDSVDIDIESGLDCVATEQ